MLSQEGYPMPVDPVSHSTPHATSLLRTRPSSVLPHETQIREPRSLETPGTLPPGPREKDLDYGTAALKDSNQWETAYTKASWQYEQELEQLGRHYLRENIIPENSIGFQALQAAEPIEIFGPSPEMMFGGLSF